MSSDGIGGSPYRHIGKPAENTAIFCNSIRRLDSVSRSESYCLASEITERKRMSCSMSDEKVLLNRIRENCVHLFKLDKRLHILLCCFLFFHQPTGPYTFAISPLNLGRATDCNFWV